MSALGFLDGRAAAAASRRLVLRERLRCMRESATTLLDRLDQASQSDRDRIAALVERGIELTDGNIEGAVGGEAIDLIEGHDVREQQLLQGTDLVLQFLDALAEGVGHGLFSIGVKIKAEPIRAEAGAHRLCGGAK